MSFRNKLIETTVINQQFITEKELAVRWNISVKKLQADRFKGIGIPYIKIGKLCRYSMNTILEYESANLQQVNVGGKQ